MILPFYTTDSGTVWLSKTFGHCTWKNVPKELNSLFVAQGFKIDVVKLEITVDTLSSSL